MLIIFWILLSILSVLTVYLKRKNARAHPLPPAYPGALPIIGHTHILLGTSTGLWESIKSVSDHCLKQGGVTYAHLGMDTYYLVSDPEDALTLANTCLSKKHDLYHYLAGLLGQGLLTISEEKIWKHHRKTLSPAFSLKNLHNFIPNFNSQSRKLVAKINECSGREPMDMSVYLKELNMETTLLSIFGNKLQNEEQPYYKYSQAGEKFTHMIIDRFRKVWLHYDIIYKLLGYFKQVELLKTDLTEVFEKALKVKKANEGSMSALSLDDRFKTFFELFLQAPDSSSFTDDDIKAEVNNIIAAAYETSSDQTVFVLYYIATHPEVQERVYQEVMEVIGKERDVERKDLLHLKYTEAVVKESLRILPTVPVIARYIDRDLKLKNYTLRRGTYGVLILHGINHHSDWVDPDQFRPERWLQPDTLPANSSALAAFAIGKRNCIGKPYAMTLMTVMVAHIVRAYRLSAVSTMQCKFEFTLKPAGGHEIKIQRRNL